MTSWDYTYLSIEDSEALLKNMMKAGLVKCIKKGYACTNNMSYEYDTSGRSFEYTEDKKAINKAKEYYSNYYDIPYKNITVKRVPHLDKFIEIETNKEIDSYLIRRNYQIEGFQRFMAEYKNEFCMIKTDNGFWHQSHSGYVTQSKAGIFTIEEGYNAIAHCGLSKVPQLYIVSIEDLKSFRVPLEENLERLNKYIKILETGEK